MSIKSKIFAVFFLLLIMVAVIVVYSGTNIKNAAVLIGQTYDKPLMASNFARDALVGYLRLQKDVFQNGYDKARFQKLYGDVTSSLDVVQERLVSPQSQPFLDKTRQLLKQWSDQVAAHDMQHAKETGAAFEEETDLLIENEFSAAHDFVIDTRAKVDHTNMVLLMMNGLCLFISFVGGLFLFMSVYRPIKTCIAISEKIASGHFDNTIQERGSTEFRHLLAALREMQSKLILHIEERQKVLNCLGQGFLMFDRSGICTPVYSRSCQTLLETTPPGKHIADILHLEGAQREKFDRLLKLAFDGRHVQALDLLTSFAPQSYPHSQGMHIRLDYKTDPGAENGTINDIIIIATDITKQVQAQVLAEKQKHAFESIERVLRDRRSFGSYMRRAEEFAETVSGDINQLDVAEITREAHTLKGGAGAFRLAGLVDAFHDFESALRPAAADAPSAPMDLSGMRRQSSILKREIGAVRNQFNELLGADVVSLETESNLNKGAIFGFADYLSARGLEDVRREYIRRVCAESFVDSFKHFNIQLEDLANRFNKKVFPIRFVGTDIPFLVDNYKKMLESFVHIFRNIMDHGIETPTQRVASGKNESGQIEIRFGVPENLPNQQWLNIEIRDDGAGIDIDKVREKLHAREPDGNWFQRSDQQVLDRMLIAGVSTNDGVSQYSGRGIGLNAVYHEVRKLGGTMSMHSMPGHGTSFLIKVPYILNITAAA
jgi:two-component system, chemotaxis family, sensor kinase CheA